MATDKRLTGSEKVRRLQTIRHEKAKEEPQRRFHTLIDKVWRINFLQEAWRMVGRNGGSAGVDGETIADIEAWLRELSQDLKEGTCQPQAVRQVLIPKKTPRKVPTAGHTVPPGSGRPDFGDAGIAADLRG